MQSTHFFFPIICTLILLSSLSPQKLKPFTQVSQDPIVSLLYKKLFFKCEYNGCYNYNNVCKIVFTNFQYEINLSNKNTKCFQKFNNVYIKM